MKLSRSVSRSITSIGWPVCSYMIRDAAGIFSIHSA
jgi:hypothetical protein